MHKRQTIREAIVTLVTGLATTADRVTVGRVYPVEAAARPTLDVTTTEESRGLTLAGGPPYKQTRELTVVITARASGDDYLDQLDQVALEVEQALAADLTLGGLVNDMNIDSTEVDASGETETPTGALQLSYEIRYSTNAQDPQ